MRSIHLFCAADDQHRVKLLVEVLGQTQRALQSQQSVTLRAGPVARPSDPCLVACTARALRAPWIQALFRSDHTVVAIRLDDTPLPGPCTRVVDIQTWPARSADREVEALAVWLDQLISGTPVESNHAASAASAADVPAPSGRREPRGGRRVRPAPRHGELTRGLMLLGLVVVGLSLLWLSTQREPPVSGNPTERPLLDGRSPAGGTAAPVEAAPGGRAGAGTTAGSAGAAVGGVGPDGVGGDGGPRLPVPVPQSEPASVSIPDAATTGFADAVEHLCRAETPAAARAWAGVLDWKQQRRAVREPCVRALLQRPEFEAVATLLDLS